MIVCSECGNSAASVDGFCSSCGALLEWSGQPVEATASAADGSRPHAARQPVAERPRPDPVPLVTEPVHAGPYCSACGVRNPEGRTFCRSCGELLRAGGSGPGSAPGWWRRLLSRLRGRRSYAAGDRPRGFLSHSAVSGPAASAAAGGAAAGSVAGPATLTPPAAAHLASPHLASPHLASPHLASPHLGSLAGAAGQRIRRVKRPRRLVLSRFAPLLLAAGVLGVGLGPARMWLTTHAFGLAHRTQVQLTQRYTDVVPVSAAASSSVPGHRAKLAIDGVQQTYWLTEGHDGTGATLTIRFASPQRIDRIGVLSGEPAAAYRRQARPRTIEVTADGRPPVTLAFDDTPSFQNRLVTLRRVTAITVVIKDAYPGQKGQAVALRELEFFTRI